MQICDAYCINRETWKRCLAAYTLLSCCTLVSPRAANANVPDELLRCVQNPVEIGEYDWAGYILDVLRASAERFQQEMNEGAPSLTSGGSNLFLQLYCLEWTDFRKHSLDTDLVPKIGAYTTEKIKELIKLEMQDRLLKSPRYKMRSVESMASRARRLHPLIAGAGTVKEVRAFSVISHS
ncbi:uncharacterized protein LOC119353484 [Triticum dicoccoides]|uniref:uncharacterized protein LOC119353484 n=1 Tax=Triticum dicoccoides TaxID=85692 RepID=UPI00188DE3CD|nr:uncharacterized protein LOC119353484 [Triticum dicoccoides]